MFSAGSTVGILGGGQLGRFLAREARTAGYRVVIRTDDAPGGPGAQEADDEISAPYDDAVANDRFAHGCDVITAEFENLPVALLDTLSRRVPVHPGAFSIGTCQHRRREKEFLAANGVPHARFVVVQAADEVRRAVGELGGSGMLKTTSFGYDGRGQIRLTSTVDPDAAWRELNAPEAVVEQLVPFVMELSVVGARGVDGSWRSFPPGENVHVNGILDHTISPARISPAVAMRADDQARQIANALDHVGTIGVEFFLLADGSLVVNEMAPRPHNSGHHTIDSCATSQFGLQLQAVTGAALGDTTQHRAAVMVNLLGDLWRNGEPDWSTVLREPNAHLHLYGKGTAKPGRKMGHLTMLAGGLGELDGPDGRGGRDGRDELINEAKRLRATLGGAAR